MTVELETKSYIFFAAHSSEAFPSPLKGGQVAAALPPPCLSLILWQTEPAALAHTAASNISNALRAKAMWSCPSLPAIQHIRHSAPVMITLSFCLSYVTHSPPAGGGRSGCAF